MTVTDRPASERPAVVRALLARLDDYLAGAGLYLPVFVDVAGRREAGTLTLGVVLDAIDAVAHDDPEAGRALRADLDAAVGAHRAAYLDKLGRELRSAVSLWRAAADDLARDPERAGESWVEAARQRTRAAELVAEHARTGAAAPAPQLAALAAADDVVRAHTVPGPFALRAADAERWPADRAWWLWRRPSHEGSPRRS